MTDKEKAIVMAHTGICMLAGDKFQIFHKYVEDIMGRSIMTHEIGWLADTIKEKTKTDFLALCEDESGSEKPNTWIPVSERLPEVKYDSLGNNISDYVLLWVKKGDYETYKVGYFSPPNYFDAITSDGWFISVCALKDVIAWMPLPEPHKAESEDKENE